MRDVLVPCLASQLAQLRQQVERINYPGNIDGMFARYVCTTVNTQPLEWNVLASPEMWRKAMLETRFSFSSIAALGFQIDAVFSAELAEIFRDGLARLRQKEVYPEDRFAFAFHPVAYLGIALGAIASAADPDMLQWLEITLRSRPACERSPFAEVIEEWSRAITARSTRRLAPVDRERTLEEVGAIFVGMRKRLIDVPSESEVTAMHIAFLRSVCVTGLTELNAKEAAVVWSAATYLISASISDLVLSRSHVTNVLERFTPAMRRWRWDDPDKVKDPIRWRIHLEREVQDILWLMLRPVFEDLIDEEALPKVGHGFTKSDFGIPSLRLLIEAKYCRSAADFKKVESEVIVDSFKYLARSSHLYDSIVVFIYDESASVQEHDVTRSALMLHKDVSDVVIVSRPSHVPSESQA